MDTDTSYQQHVYQNLVKTIDYHLKAKSNLLILNLPGMGATHFLQAYSRKNKNICYIDTPNQQILDTNILNLHFNNNPDAPQVVQDYFSQATKYQKFIVSLNLPHLTEDTEFKKKFNFLSNLYSHYYLPPLDLHDSKIMLDEINPTFTKKQINQIHTDGQGICRLLKFFGLNHQKNYNPSELSLVTTPLTDVLSKCSSDLGSKFNLTSTSILPFSYHQKIDININFDLSFSEKSQLNYQKLTKEESLILKFLLQNNYQITKEQIADIKWGKDTYDKFSDQAITQAIRRLKSKLKAYQINTIPNVGYSLT